MLNLLRFWFTFEAHVTPVRYRTHGAALMALKYAGDIALVWTATHTWWTPADYFSVIPSMVMRFHDAPAWLMPALAIWTLPFVWIGVTLTARRAYDAGWSLWWSLLFFVPLVNYTLMLVLCVVPTAAPHRPAVAGPPRAPRPGIGRPLAMAVAAGALIGAAAVAIVGFDGQYALPLFVGTPFTMGAVTGFAYNRLRPASRAETIRTTIVMLLAALGLTLLLGTEGIICVLMAMPLIVPIALMGALVGREIARRSPHDLGPAIASALLPLAAVLQPSHDAGRTLHEVRSAIEIAAPADRVWPHVIAFAPITDAPDLPFRLGIAAPLSARIVGDGVGAIRYCEFTTGPFVEPITAWEPARRLAFDVAGSPPVMRELGLYSTISPPHLQGYLRSRHGEFRLVRLPDGHTRLEGSTWYELQMAPEGYWQVLADYFIHRIHARVLAHIKEETERIAAPALR
jgi:uncharacterized membrane protein YhaH (DUF805 family)